MNTGGSLFAAEEVRMNNRTAFKMLLRSPVKTALTVLLLAAACFLLLDNLSSYAMQTEAIRQAEEAVEGVLTVERSQVLRPADAMTTEFLFTDPTSQETSYYRYVRNERVHHEALNEDDLAALEALPYIDAVDRRYMTAGLSEDYARLDGPLSYYGYTDRVILEATVNGYEDFPEVARIRPSYTIADGEGNRIFYLKDVVLLAGSGSALAQLEKLQKSGISLFVFAMQEKYIGVEPDIRMHSGGGGDVVDCYDYDIDRAQLLSVQKNQIGRAHV